ncbi:hypothetical protein AMTR_s00005p00254760, partial [Amborella trichopoda]
VSIHARRAALKDVLGNLCITYEAKRHTRQAMLEDVLSSMRSAERHGVAHDSLVEGHARRRGNAHTTIRLLARSTV